MEYRGDSGITIRGGPRGPAVPFRAAEVDGVHTARAAAPGRPLQPEAEPAALVRPHLDALQIGIHIGAGHHRSAVRSDRDHRVGRSAAAGGRPQRRHVRDQVGRFVRQIVQDLAAAVLQAEGVVIGADQDIPGGGQQAECDVVGRRRRNAAGTLSPLASISHWSPWPADVSTFRLSALVCIRLRLDPTSPFRASRSVTSAAAAAMSVFVSASCSDPKVNTNVTFPVPAFRFRPVRELASLSHWSPWPADVSTFRLSTLV